MAAPWGDHAHSRWMIPWPCAGHSLRGIGWAWSWGPARADLDALFDAQTKHLSACDAQAGAPGQLGDNATKEFVLRHVFEIAPELIKQPSDLLRVLLRRHYRGQRIPAILDERFIQVLRQNGLFEGWPLETIIPDAQAFFAFLQERWPVFLDSLAKPKDDAVHEDAPVCRAGHGAGRTDYGFEFPGPTLLPFDHRDVRIYIDNLFLEGLLQPVPHEQSQALAKTWVAYGIKVSPLPAPRRGQFAVYVIKCRDGSFYIAHTDDLPRRYNQHLAGQVTWTASRRPLEIIHWELFGSRESAIEREKELKTGFGRKWLKREYAAGRLAARQAGVENRRRRMEGLLDSIEKTIPTVEARHGEWLHFAYRWAELVALELEPDTTLPEEYRERLEALRSRIDSALTGWVVKRYASLINLPPAPPVMLHHIPRFLARSLGDDRRTKIAFLLVDGLALDQWIALREVLGELDSKLRFRENAVFAWIPTITSVSRQAAFAGKPPIYFPASIHTTDKEPALWTQFWVDQGLTQHEVAYAKGLGDLSACDAQAGGDLDEVSELLSRPRLRVVGLVIDKVDRIMHGMELGAAGMHNQVRQWARQGFMRDHLGLLQTQGFQVYLASDHGNIEARGVGRPAEGAVADLRGERVRVYSDPRLRAQIKERFPESLEWPSVGLPEDYLALVAPNRAAFVRAGETLVGHGGMSVEELIVPFVQIDRKDR